MGSSQKNIAVCPSAGIGHLIPFLRLTSMLSNSSNFRLTLVTLQPTLSIAEANLISSFLSSHPHIHSFDIHLPNDNTTARPTDGPDPFLIRYAAISQSAYQLTAQIVSMTPPPTVVISDIMFAAGFNQGLAPLGIHNYLLATMSARFFSLITYLPHLVSEHQRVPEVVDDEEDVYFPPGMSPVPITSIPPPFFNLNHIFTRMLATNSMSFYDFKGIIFNTFEDFEADTIASLRTKKSLSNLPPIYPIGPLKPWDHKAVSSAPTWLDSQPAKSVLYISFGSRTAMGGDQIKELGYGLELAGVRFLWVVKTKIVDKEESQNDDEVRKMLGESFFMNTKERGVVLREWVDQEAVLDHPAIGGFLTHCGWNSTMEVAHRGIPVLAWPQHGDQMVNAGVVEKAGLGVWGKGWSWAGERVVKGEEIAEKIKEVMMDEELRVSAKNVAQDVAKAWGVDGSSSKMLAKIIADIIGCNN